MLKNEKKMNFFSHTEKNTEKKRNKKFKNLETKTLFPKNTYYSP